MGGRGGASHSGRPAPNARFGNDPFAPAYMQFASQQEAIDYHLQHNFNQDTWDQALVETERRGIYYYTGSYYSEMNTDLREGRTSRPDIEQMINGATSGLSKFHAADDVIVFRGSNLHWVANLLGGTEAQMSNAAFLRSRIGRIVTDRGFMSTGTHPDSSWVADVNFKIYVNRGISGMYVDRISANSGEYEFLFNRDTSFRVHSITTDSRGRINNMVLEAIRSAH